MSKRNKQIKPRPIQMGLYTLLRAIFSPLVNTGHMSACEARKAMAAVVDMYQAADGETCTDCGQVATGCVYRGLYVQLLGGDWEADGVYMDDAGTDYDEWLEQGQAIEAASNN